MIGEFARTPRFQGAGSSQVNPTRVDSPLDELRAVLGDLRSPPATASADTSRRTTPCSRRRIGSPPRPTVVMVIGLPGADESEGFDRTHMDLPADQLRPLRRWRPAEPAGRHVLVNGATVDLGEVIPHAPALLEAWLGGQAAGGAIADVLSGAVNPSGRLAETLPLRLEDNPSYLNFPGDAHVVRYGEGLFIGYRAYDKANSRLRFPFGFGLSYTSFELSDLTVEAAGSAADGDAGGRVERHGDQHRRPGRGRGGAGLRPRPHLYRARPVRELKGFAKVAGRGSPSRVTVELDARAFAFWSDRYHRWIVEAGEFVIEVGHHSRDLPLVETITVEAPRLTGPLDRDSTLQEWMSDPVGARRSSGRWPTVSQRPC